MTGQIGRIFDRKYRIIRLIGEGGMGAVYEAEHTVIQRKVAVKVMHAEFSSMQEVVDRFFREAQASSAIGHPNIIEVYDVGIESDGTVFIVMELLHGESLASKMKHGETLPPESAVAVILQILSALVVAHDKGIIHRDLKPDNVFLSVDSRGRNEVKLLDFGIAKVQGAMEGDQGLTKTGTVLGTPNYMSPEQARGRDVDHRIDIWAAGVMLYELLCGRLPYSGDSYNEVLSKILLDDPPALERISTGISAGLVAVVEKAMAKDRDDRYNNVTEMIEDLIPFHASGNDLMTDSAATALKRSLIPPPVGGQQDTLLATDADLLFDFNGSGVRKLDSRPAPKDPGPKDQVTTVDRTASVSPKPVRRRRGLTLWRMVLLFAILVSAGLMYYYKRDNQTVAETGRALVDQAIAFWTGQAEDLPPVPKLSDFTVGLPVKTPTPPAYARTVSKPNTEALTEAAEQAAEKIPVPVVPKEVTIALEGFPKNARVTAGGKKVTPPFHLNYSKKPVTIKINIGHAKPITREITPDKDQTLQLDSKKKTRSDKEKKTQTESKKKSHPKHTKKKK